MRPYLLALLAGAALVLPARAADTRFPDDAALHAVQFLDADVGYAVGDDGVILKTINGGKSWELLPTRTRASLQSLHMLSHLVGWVVGREELPHGQGSVGVVLCTTDGGESWRRILADTVPGLNHVRFGDGDTAYLIGDGSDQYPTGVFLTTDAGRNWKAIKGPRCTTWLGGDFLNGQTAALAGAWSRLGTLREGNFGKAEVDAFGGRNLRGMQLRQGKSFAVGQGGLVLESKTQGNGWGYTDTKLPEDVRATWDFHAVCCVGDKVWIVGRPGSAVLYSEDKGTTWTVHKTGQSLPLNAVYFFDDKRGWAVGEFGCILATGDGGKTWAVQRRGGQRAAILCVHAAGHDLPVDTVALLGGEQGLLTAALRVTGPDPKSDAIGEAAQAQRFAAGLRSAGGTAGEMLWQFPLPQDLLHADRTELLKYWDRLHGDKAAQQLLRQLVLTIRTWRPDAVITDHPDVKATGSAASALVAEALHEAFKQAADPKAFPEQIEQLGLQPWRVSKVYALWDRRDGAHIVVDNNRVCGYLQATCAEHAQPAAALLTATPVVPAERCFRLLDTTVPTSAKDKDLLDGLKLGPVGECRRLQEMPAELNEKVTAALKAQRELLKLAKNPDSGLASSAQLLGQLGKTLANLPEDRAAKATLAIAGEFARQGQWDLARETYLTLVERYPTHPLSIDACRWLIRHNASGEAQRRHELGQFLVLTRQGEGTPVGDPKGLTAVKPGVDMQVTFLGSPAELLHFHKGSLLLAKRLAGFGPVYVNDPAIQFCLAASNRRLGDVKAAQAFYTGYCGDYGDGPWRECAAQELWFVNRVGLAPRPIAQCRFTDKKPYLDGKFDDACWQGQKPMVLKNAVHETAKEYPTEAMLSYDDKFLYIALRCQHPAGQGVPPAKERPRDADLRGFDRVSILLDLDRDYSTYFRLEVDQRGCVCEDCWGDRTWNPKWFVAIRSEDDCWQIEAAIPLHELTGERVSSKSTCWACNIVRILPGRGVQAWSTPAGVEPRPEGMGLMVFPQAEAAKMP
jgi:photosystem II stability/assembly factor-like uncharacterized protein